MFSGFVIQLACVYYDGFVEFWWIVKQSCIWWCYGFPCAMDMFGCGITWTNFMLILWQIGVASFLFDYITSLWFPFLMSILWTGSLDVHAWHEFFDIIDSWGVDLMRRNSWWDFIWNTRGVVPACDFGLACESWSIYTLMIIDTVLIWVCHG